MQFLKYFPYRRSIIEDSLISVSGRRRRGAKPAVKARQAGLLLILLFSRSAWVYASAVGNEIPYQTYRDFAENKGVFKPGARDIEIYKKNGAAAGMLDKAPMPDFSSVNVGSAVATLISPQYIVSVKHNGGYRGVSFGNEQNYYEIVNRNNHPRQDFHAPRLNKLVTEAAPAEVTSAGVEYGTYSNKLRFPVFYRLGSGNQKIKDRNGKLHQISRAYSYVTGGTMGSPSLSYWRIVNRAGEIYSYTNGPLASYGLAGDSGSPALAWDAEKNKWVVVGVYSIYTGENGLKSTYDVIPVDFTREIASKNTDAPVSFLPGKGALRWTFNASTGEGSLKQGDDHFSMHGEKDGDVDAGKNLTFIGEHGKVVLQENVNQGAGTLTFKNSYSVVAENNAAWMGGGIDVAQDSVVTWAVKGVKGDNLHKIGAGTLKINGSGVNEGGLKTGDGTVILSQQPDESGKVQAFSTVNMASGRAVVVLSDGRQINPDKISWGFRGGILDVNGNDVAFHKINAADNGAVIANASATASLLTISPVTDFSVTVNEWGENKGSGGEKGLLYKYNNNHTGTIDYFIQNKKGYGYFPTNQAGNSDWEYVGHDELAAKKRVFSRRPKDNFLFHGNLIGNLNVRTDVSASTGDVAFDGNIDIPRGVFSQSEGRLTFQGHPVIHAYNDKVIADKLKSMGDDSVRVQPVSFEQPDWESRIFILKRLDLKNADFRLARNASMTGDISANHSVVTLGSPSLYIDLNDGDGKKPTIQEGVSVASHASDMSDYHGKVTLKNRSSLDIQEKFSGSITAYDSSVSVASRQALLSGYSLFRKTPLVLRDGAAMVARGGLWSDSAVTVNPGARLTLSATPGAVAPDSFIPTEYRVRSFTLSGSGAELQMRPWISAVGDILASGSASIAVGDKTVDAGLDKNLPFHAWLLSSRFRDFKNIWQGRVDAAHARMSVTSTDWKMYGNSRVHAMTISDSRVSFNGPRFTGLTVDTLKSDRSAFVLRTDLKRSDNITIKQQAQGKDNFLFVDFLSKPSDRTTLNIPLVSAPTGTDPAMFQAAERVTGFSMVTPRIHTEDKAGQTRWILDGFKVTLDQGATRSANSFLKTGYKSFLTEVNNLNKRMGDLRDTGADNGLWARIMNGAGTGNADYSDRYTHFQLGIDRKRRLNGADLFTGALMSQTDSHADGSAFSGKTRSLGGGLYASLMADSGIYVDVIGKYVHHDNEYTAAFIESGKQRYGTHSWYAGVEAGYRHSLPGGLYVEPQVELVYGAVSGSRFQWSADGMNMSMTTKHYNPLTGRTGLAFGKAFTGGDWQVAVRVGLDYQFDLASNGETALRDASGEHRFTGEKDSRMLYNIGIDARLKDNMRVGLELERSAFGKYNVDHVINANLRYMF